jgi:hypothetical protein
MSKHDRQYETVTAHGQKIMMVDGPSEIASWVFPHEPDEDEKRIALAAEIDKLIDKRIAEALARRAGDERPIR